MNNSITNISRTLITWWVQAVKDFYTVEKPDKLTRKGWLQSVDYFSNVHFSDTEAVIAIGGEAKKKPKYPSSTIAQMALWALRKQAEYELPITIALNLAPALEFNEISKKSFYSEKEQRSRIISDLKLFGATPAEVARVRFDLSTQNPKYLNLIQSIKSGDMKVFPLYEKLFSVFGRDTEFTQDIERCIPEQVKNGEWDSSFHYALIEIHEIIEAYKKGQRIKIGYEREKLYDEVFLKILDGKYPELLDITRELNGQQSEEKAPRWDELFGSVYWDERADRNSTRLREKLIYKKRLQQLLYATPVIVWLIVWWEYHQYRMSQVREQAYRAALWNQGAGVLVEFNQIDNLNQKAKWLDYTVNFFPWRGVVYEWKDKKVKAMQDVGSSIAISLADYVYGKIETTNDIEIHNNKSTLIASRWVSLEIAKMLEEEKFEKYIMSYNFDSGFLSKEFYNEMVGDPRFAKIFKLYTGEDWKNTPEFKNKVFYWYSK
ncbi:MAG: hypothetical protein ACD_71C00073G0002 [uncultured bacterium (gcode 4)]|uniref:Uncharacterized protein n=1 Tax=uncultured bacterium (gcode 4) TaxID=1234023 RepID=K1YNV9_9BACT|nr:MAG: hypothetical protein ACD_71C00073G0002 [uncultured bacterium (gcode 4)]